MNYSKKILLPSGRRGMEAGRAYEAFKTKSTDLGGHIYLRQLQDSNETLFYRLISISAFGHGSTDWPRRFGNDAFGPA